MNQEDIDEILDYYHYGFFVPQEALRFSLGWLFYPIIEWILGIMGLSEVK